MGMFMKVLLAAVLVTMMICLVDGGRAYKSSSARKCSGIELRTKNGNQRSRLGRRAEGSSLTSKAQHYNDYSDGDHSDGSDRYYYGKRMPINEYEYVQVVHDKVTGKRWEEYGCY